MGCINIKKYKNLIENIFLFLISNLIPKLLTFLLIPLYTKYLSTEEYGTLELISTTVSLLIPLITLNISDALLRFLLDDRIENKDVFNISFKIFIYDTIISIIFLIIMLTINPFNLDKIYSVFLSLQLVINIFYNLCIVYLKGIEKVKKIVTASIINSILTFVTMFICLIIFNQGILGYVISVLIGPFFSSIYMFFSSKIYKNISFKVNVSLLKSMIKYSFPMIFSAIAWWINNSSDRYIITAFLGISISGIYSVSSKIPAILKTFQNIFLQAWSISAIKEYDKNDSDGFIGKTFSVMNLFMILFCSIIMLFNIIISKYMYSGEFFIAWKNVPPLLVSILFDSLGLFLGSIFYAAKDTKSLSVANISGAVINIFLNLCLIKLFSAYGAAIATFVSYLATYVIIITLARKHINMKTNNFQNFIGHILIIMQMIFAYYGNKYAIIQVLILILILLLYKKIFILLINEIKNKLKKRLKNEKN